MATRTRPEVARANDLSPNTASAWGQMEQAFFPSVVVNMDAWVTGGVELQATPTEVGSRVTFQELERAALAYRYHLGLIEAMSDWKSMPPDRHEHPQLESEPDD